MNKEEFAYKIVEGYDMDTLIDTAVQGILDKWEQYPSYLKEEIENRQDILQGRGIEDG